MPGRPQAPSGFRAPGGRVPRPSAGPDSADGPVVGPGTVAAGDPVLPAQPSPAGRAAGERDAAGGALDPEVAALIARAQAGDSEAFGRIYDRYVDLVYRYVYYRVGSVALAEDLVSETFLRALRRISSFTWQGRDLGAWLVTIARNLIADHYKSGRYRLEVATSDLVEATGDRPGTETPEDLVLSALSSAALIDAVRRLNPEQQECIVLRFLQGLSVAETAEAMGKNDGAIKALQYRAVRSLAKLLPAAAP